MSAAKKPEVGDTWYRYEDRRYGVVNEFDDLVGSYAKLELVELKVTKVTPKGVWLTQFWTPRFVLLAANKRYAHPTKAEALASLKARRTAQVRILEKQVAGAREVIRLVDQEMAKLQPPGEPVASAAEPLLVTEVAFA